MRAPLFPKCRRRFFASVACCVVAAGVQAQTASQDIDRASLLQNQSRLHQDPYSDENGVADDGRAAASPNDPDLGEQEILKRVERYEPFTVSVGAPFYYTSNVALSRHGAHDDFLVAAAAAVTYAPRITKTFFGEITVQQQFFSYDRFSNLDFGSFDLRLGFAYYLPQVHNLVLRAEYDLNRLTTDSFDEFYSNHTIFLSAELPFRIGRAQQVSFGADANLSFYADPDAPQRNEFDLYTGYDVKVTRSLSLDAVARLFIREYSQSDRVDVSEVLALSANYRFTNWFTAGIVSSYASSQSSQSVFDYNVVNIGGALTFALKF